MVLYDLTYPPIPFEDNKDIPKMMDEYNVSGDDKFGDILPETSVLPKESIPDIGAEVTVTTSQHGSRNIF